MDVLAWAAWLSGLTIWLSAWEWAAHRFLMHRPRGGRYFYEHARRHHGRHGADFHFDPRDPDAQATLSIRWRTTLLLCLPSLPLAWWSLPGYACFALATVAHNRLWNAAHREMHYRQGGWVRALPGFAFWEWWHFLHHRHPGSNYNALLPVCDWVLGTRARADAADRAAWALLPAPASGPPRWLAVALLLLAGWLALAAYVLVRPYF